LYWTVEDCMHSTETLQKQLVCFVILKHNLSACACIWNNINIQCTNIYW
jgi:hypothetical protein